MPSLLVTRSAQCEEVVGTWIRAGCTGSRPIRPEPGVGPAATFAGLDVGEPDLVSGDPRPIDLTLMSGDIHAVALARTKRWPPVRHEGEPEQRTGERDRDQGSAYHPKPGACSPCAAEEHSTTLPSRSSGADREAGQKDPVTISPAGS